MSQLTKTTMKTELECMKRAFYYIAHIGMVVLLLSTISCSDDDNNKPAAQIKLASSATLGDYLTDADGNTLYFFSNDAKGENTCQGGCATAWPIFFKDGLTADMLSNGLDFADFGTITSAAGQQTTYKGWPLYYYAPGGVREAPNTTTGEAVNNVWFVAKADYTIMLTRTQLKGLDGKNYKGDYTEGDALVLYFTDAEGMTLYTFVNDKKNKNNFTNGTAAHDAIWPIYTGTLASVPSTLDKSLFGTIDVSGAKQLTYKGWPIYYYTNDAVRGDNKGVSVPTPGIWPVAVKDAVDAPE